MLDLSIFPHPLEVVDPLVLSDENTRYVSTELTLGYDNIGDLKGHSTGNSSSCIQQVMRILLSKKGSVPSEPNYGSNIHRLISDGYNPDSLLEDVILIILDVENQCKARDITSNTPLNAQLDSIEVLDIDESVANQIKISLGVTTVSGISLSFDLSV